MLKRYYPRNYSSLDDHRAQETLLFHNNNDDSSCPIMSNNSETESSFENKSFFTPSSCSYSGMGGCEVMQEVEEEKRETSILSFSYMRRNKTSRGSNSSTTSSYSRISFFHYPFTRQRHALNVIQRFLKRVIMKRRSKIRRKRRQTDHTNEISSSSYSIGSNIKLPTSSVADSKKSNSRINLFPLYRKKVEEDRIYLTNSHDNNIMIQNFDRDEEEREETTVNESGWNSSSSSALSESTNNFLEVLQLEIRSNSLGQVTCNSKMVKFRAGNGDFETKYDDDDDQQDPIPSQDDIFPLQQNYLPNNITDSANSSNSSPRGVVSHYDFENMSTSNSTASGQLFSGSKSLSDINDNDRLIPTFDTILQSKSFTYPESAEEAASFETFVRLYGVGEFNEI